MRSGFFVYSFFNHEKHKTRGRHEKHETFVSFVQNFRELRGKICPELVEGCLFVRKFVRRNVQEQKVDIHTHHYFPIFILGDIGNEHH